MQLSGQMSVISGFQDVRCTGKPTRLFEAMNNELAHVITGFGCADEVGGVCSLHWSRRVQGETDFCVLSSSGS